MMQELFVNVEKETGATIISAAGGEEYALEGGLHRPTSRLENADLNLNLW
jgi:hypothetical protein